MPFIFPAIKVDGMILVDGGVSWNLDVSSAIEKCRTLVDSDSKIILDIIDVDKNMDFLPQWNETKGPIKNFLRYLSLKRYRTRMNDIVEIEFGHPKV